MPEVVKCKLKNQKLIGDVTYLAGERLAFHFVYLCL